MKTTYLKPETNTIYITVGHLMSQSNPEQGFNTEELPETEDIDGNLTRRRRDVWEDGEEEEEVY